MSHKDIIDKLEDLHKQATTERSHYYVGSLCAEAAIEILKLRGIAKELYKQIRDKDLKEIVTDQSGSTCGICKRPMVFCKGHM